MGNGNLITVMKNKCIIYFQKCVRFICLVTSCAENTIISYEMTKIA